MITYSIYTNIGQRKINEDSIGAFEKADGKYCFLVCDGLGGHGMGDIASTCVKDVFGDCFSKSDRLENFLPYAFTASQDILLQEQIERKAQKKMKTTVAALVINSENTFIGHIGDSRVYVFNRNKVKCRTLDHSIPQMMVLSRQLKDSEIRNHPDRNIVLRVMGVPWDEPKFELMEPIPLKKCQAFLLCSDGFWELIAEKQMCACLKQSKTPEDWLQLMIKIVNENGKEIEMDNNSAIAIWVE